MFKINGPIENLVLNPKNGVNASFTYKGYNWELVNVDGDTQSKSLIMIDPNKDVTSTITSALDPGQNAEELITTKAAEKEKIAAPLTTDAPQQVTAVTPATVRTNGSDQIVKP